MASIINLSPTTELEAVNAMLSAIGEAPIADSDATDHADADIAIATLRDTAREVQANGWRFNTEFGLALAPTATNFAWIEPGGASLPIDIFTPPARLVSFQVSAVQKQFLAQYGALLDLVIRPAKQYSSGALVLYDRSRNRDGVPASEDRDFLYIDPVWLFDFEKLPETARRYIVALAARRFTQRVLGDVNVVGLQEQDIMLALRSLTREHGLKNTGSMLDHPDAYRILGSRGMRSGIYLGSRPR